MAHADVGGVSPPVTGNLVSERRAARMAARRGGGFAPVLMREPVALVVADPPVAAHGVVVRKTLMCQARK